MGGIRRGEHVRARARSFPNPAGRRSANITGYLAACVDGKFAQSGFHAESRPGSDLTALSPPTQLVNS